MNKTNKALLVAVIILVGVLAPSPLKAAPVTWVTGDVLLGFENSSHTLNYLYDLGAGGTFASALSGGSFSAVNLNADLSSVFGSDWATNATTGVSYGVFGIPANKSIIYASVASGNAALPLKASGALATTLSHYGTLGAEYNQDLTVPAQTWTLGVQQNVGTSPDTGFATWSGNFPYNSPFAVYNTSLQNLVSGNLDIYGTTGTTSTKLGAFTLSSGGVLSEVAAVPEPSTYALFGLGALTLIVARRRKIKAVAV